MMHYSAYLLAVLAVVFGYFFSVWLLKRMNMGRVRWLVAVFPAAVLSPVIYFLTMIVIMFSSQLYIPRDFNKKEWVANEDERYKMTGDIIDNEMLIGLTRNEVFELLGEKPGDNNFDCISYYVGHPGGMLANIDPDILKICFENDRVTEVTQYTS